MQYLGIEYQMKHAPKLDTQFIPFGVWRASYLKDAKQPISIAVERDQGRVSVHHTCIHGTPAMAEADYRYVERYVKFLLWSTGGFRVSICGCSPLAQRLKAAYTPKGERAFDYTFVHQLYERELEILDLPLDQCPTENEQAQPIGGYLDGCRIGFDAGGSDRKVSAVIDGECAGVRKDQAADGVCNGGVFLNTPVVDLQVIVHQILVVQQSSVDIADLLSLLTVQNVGLGNVGVAGVGQNLLHAVLNVFNGNDIVLDLGLKIGCHLQSQQIDHAGMILAILGLKGLGHGSGDLGNIKINKAAVSLLYAIHKHTSIK